MIVQNEPGNYMRMCIRDLLHGYVEKRKFSEVREKQQGQKREDEHRGNCFSSQIKLRAEIEERPKKKKK